MNRYSAKMLFQFRADLGEGRSNVMRLCEERIVVIPAKDASSALRKAKAYGKNAEMKFEETETSYPNHFEFVGITDLLELEFDTEPEEVWYDIVTMKQPSERRDKLIPKESQLNAIYWERQKNQKPNKTRHSNHH
jgi:hypothetical protein